MYAWRAGLKGVTVYVDGSHADQPVQFGEEKKEPVVVELKSKVIPFRARDDRPIALSGETVRVDTAHGAVYITVNRDSDGRIMEVFTNGGKHGSVNSADLESVARLISVDLQEGCSINRLVDTIDNISDGTFCWSRLSDHDDRPVAIKSIPDAVAKVLRSRLLGSDESVLKVCEKESADELCLNCGGSLVMIEGCMTCYSCGISRCA